MIKTRKELMDAAEKLYIPLLERTAKRYYNNYQYTVTDHYSYECTRMEEIFRPLWGISPLINERDIYINTGNEKIAVENFITDVICSGADENSPTAFDRYVTDEFKDYFANQAITEIAGYLVAVFFSKKKLWDNIEKEKRDIIAKWILKWAIYAMKNSWANNHYWYPIICIEILKHLGYDCSMFADDVQKGYDYLETMYKGNGWYCDGGEHRYDYYEAWAHHAYTLLWILIGDKSSPDYSQKADTYRRRTEEFLKFYCHYFDSDGGMVAYGRSISYRFAAVSVFGLAAVTGCDIDFGMARNIITKNIEYFLENSIPTEDNVFPCGYLYETPGFAENYASDGANCCYTEGFMALLANEDHPLWTSKESPLPVDKENFTVKPKEIPDIILSGNNEKNGITLFNNYMHYYDDNFFVSRFGDCASYYSKFAYNSRSGYGTSSADTVASDNMISLITPDGTMVSHCRRIYCLGTENGIQHSYHFPFSNDPETKIESFVVPLESGWHVRVHKVNLSREYFVLEGGFTVGHNNDDFIAKENFVLHKNNLSKIYVKTDVEHNYFSQEIHPGMHLLNPQAHYPVYQTKLLPKGTYNFVTSVLFVTDNQEENMPELLVENERVIIRQGKTEKIVNL